MACALSEKRYSAVFLDRDGVINNGDFVHSTEQLILYENAADAIKILNKAGLPVIVITNQPVVARGLCGEDMVRKINEKMVKELAKNGAKIDAVYYCPHHPEKQYAGNLAYRIDCDCRKPRIGMLEKAAADFGLDLKNCFFVGDSMRDMATAAAAGCKKILVMTGHAGSDSQFTAEPDYTCESIYEAALLIKRLSGVKAFIVAGGLGTRMQGVTKNGIPKSLLHVDGKTVIEHQLDFMKSSGIDEAVVCAGYLSDKIKDCLGDGSKFGIRVAYSLETEPLGTGGAVKNAEKFAGGTFIILYGDIIVDMNLGRLLQFHISSKSILTLVLHETDHPRDSDLVEIDVENRVREIFLKPREREPETRLANSAFFVAEPEALKFMPRKGSLEGDAVPEIIKTGRCFGYVTGEFVKDIGTPDRFFKISGIIKGSDS